MSSKYPEVRTVAVRIFTDKPVRKTPYQVKGVMMNQFPDEKLYQCLMDHIVKSFFILVFK